GRTAVASPLRICVGAANHLPEYPALAAFADRLLARVLVQPLTHAPLDELLEPARRGRSTTPDARAGDLRGPLDRLDAAARACDLTHVTGPLRTAPRRLRPARIPTRGRPAVRSHH
ncbi:hypothetical protein VM98_35785, partial [Streptomyces rubellomurinus subsp. indigoferus]